MTGQPARGMRDLIRVVATVWDNNQVSGRRAHVASPHTNRVTAAGLTPGVIHPAFVPSLAILWRRQDCGGTETSAQYRRQEKEW